MPLRFSPLCAFAIVAILLSSALASGMEGDSRIGTRYNVLLLIADDLNDSVEGFGGHPNALTPQLDRLANEGVRFLNAHANAPLCGPSRASFLTGIHPLNSGLYGYRQQVNRWRDNPMLKNAVTFMEHFRANGYAVYGTGKIFHNGHEDASVWESESGVSNFGVRPSFGPYPWDGHYRTSFGAIGWQPHPALPKSLQKVWGQGFGPLSQIPEYLADPTTGSPGYRGWVLNNKPFRYVDDTDRDLVPDEANARYVIDLLSREHERPFFIACGFNRPHTPLYAPDEYFERFPIEDIVLPPWLEGDLSDVPSAFSTKVVPGTSRDIGPSKFNDLMDAGGEEMWKRWIQAYLACVALVDDQVGAILDALETSPHGKDTLVVFIGDHGYHMGEKNYLFKNSLWEESSKVPFIVKVPHGKQGAQALDPVSLVDLYPSLIEWCGLPEVRNRDGSLATLDGRSLVPYTLPEGQPDALSETDGVLIAIAGDHALEINEPGSREQQHWSWRTRDYRYTLANTGEEELYDHRSDPHEWENLARHPDRQAIKAALRKALLAKLNLPVSNISTQK